MGQGREAEKDRGVLEMRPSGTQLKALKALEELASADHIAVSQITGASSAYVDYLLRDLAKYNYVEKVGKLYRLTPEGRRFLEEKQEVQETVKRLQEGMVEQLHEGLGGMLTIQAIENRLKIRAIVELIAGNGIIAGEDLKAHLATVAERDWNEEVDNLLPVGLADGFKIRSEEEQLEGGLGWAVIAQAIEDRLKIRAIVELMADKGILPPGELKAHLAKVVERDWDNEVEKLLPEEITGRFKLASEEKPAETTVTPSRQAAPAGPFPSRAELARRQVARVKANLASEEGQPTRLDTAAAGVFSAMEQLREGVKALKEHQKEIWYKNLSGEGESDYNPPKDRPVRKRRDTI